MSLQITTAAVIGLDCEKVKVEADHYEGLPSFNVVGLPDTAVQEARHRIRLAVKNSGLTFPKGKVVINLAPADLPKVGPAFDLPMALAVISACHDQIDFQGSDKLFVGELALDGSLRPVNGALSVAMLAAARKYRYLFVPAENAPEASLVKGPQVIPVKTLLQLVCQLQGAAELAPYKSKKPKSKKSVLAAPFDLADIKGQEQAKRALEIAAAGGHNVLLSGPPGAGKTMLARALASILPRMTINESLEATKIYSCAGLLSRREALIRARPFRSPHHSASGVSLVGGGKWPRPGEISLAHRGILFLDEFSEFPRDVLENLRQPLEDGVITIARAQGTLTFPAKFTLVAAMNPCPCGYASDPDHECTCTPLTIMRYNKKISGPLLDRIDLHLEVPRVDYEKLVKTKKSESSQTVRRRVQSARNAQEQRLGKYNLNTNGEMNSKQVRKLCALDRASQDLLKQAVSRLNLTARAYFRTLKVARTIADLSQEADIQEAHVAEALQYRTKTEE